MGKIIEVFRNECVKRGMNTAVEIAKNTCMVVTPIIATVLAERSARCVLDILSINNKVGYNDVVKVILNSSMFSDGKQEAISLLKTDGTSEYYESIICVVESSMFSDAKLKMIQEMSSK